MINDWWFQQWMMNDDDWLLTIRWFHWFVNDQFPPSSPWTSPPTGHRRAAQPWRSRRRRRRCPGFPRGNHGPTRRFSKEKIWFSLWEVVVFTGKNCFSLGRIVHLVGKHGDLPGKHGESWDLTKKNWDWTRKIWNIFRISQDCVINNMMLLGVYSGIYVVSP